MRLAFSSAFGFWTATASGSTRLESFIPDAAIMLVATGRRIFSPKLRLPCGLLQTCSNQASDEEDQGLAPRLACAN